jgi:hypothetical protein
MTVPSDNLVTVKVEVSVPKSALKCSCGGREPRQTATALRAEEREITAAVCRVGTTGDDVEIRISGTALSLEGFGYPQEGYALNYHDSLTDIPPVPPDASVSNPLGYLRQPITYQANGDWTATLPDECDAVSNTTRKIVVWHHYENEFDSYVLVEVCDVTYARCGMLPTCS